MELFLEGKWTYQPAWSPDGRFIAFLWDDWSRQDVYLVPAEGGKITRLSNSTSFIGNPSFGSAGEPPSWSPDGKQVLYVQDGDLFLSSVPDGTILRLTDTAEFESGARFSPDGEKIAYSKGGDLYVLERATSSVGWNTSRPWATWTRTESESTA
jgi:TolB protein